MEEATKISKSAAKNWKKVSKIWIFKDKLFFCFVVRGVQKKTKGKAKPVPKKSKKRRKSESPERPPAKKSKKIKKASPPPKPKSKPKPEPQKEPEQRTVRLEMTKGKKKKFYQLEMDGKSLTTSTGKLGTDGRWVFFRFVLKSPLFADHRNDEISHRQRMDRENCEIHKVTKWKNEETISIANGFLAPQPENPYRLKVCVCVFCVTL